MENQQIEIWKRILGYEESYEISNYGKVRSINRVVNNKGDSVVTIEGKLRKLKTTKLGYHSVGLYKEQKGKWFTVHRLVAIAFIPNPDNNPQVNHINGIKTDNRVDNLEWVTAKQNQQHAIRTGLKTGEWEKGDKNHRAKLDWEKVNKIRKIYKKGNTTLKEVGSMFSVSDATIGYIMKNKTWVI